MAGANLSPRQKMIGMMYLVLTALLALNISKDILNAFILVNNGLENTVVNYGEKNTLLYAEFNAAKAIDPKKVTRFWEKAQKAKLFSNNITLYLDSLKIKLIKETEGINQAKADTLHLKYVENKDNYDIPTHLLIGQSEDGSAGLARILKNKLTVYKNNMLGLFTEKERKTLNLNLTTADIQTIDGVEKWEMGNFYHTPLAASITVLSKIQMDIKNAEFEVVNKLFQSVSKKDYKFDKIEAKIITNTNYVMLGEKYTADVFLAAFSTTQNPEILIGKYDSATNTLTNISDTVTVKNGLGNYIINTNKEGVFEYEGVIKIKSPTGEVQHYPFKSEYIVAKPSLVVSPDKMNIFYIGPKNPVSISVPGIASENIKATINGVGNKITKVTNGKYNVKLVSNSPRNIHITVSAIMPNGSVKNMGSMPFIAKKLPQAFASVAGKSGEIVLNKNSFKGFRTVRGSYGKNFLFTGLPLTITKCNIEIYRNGIPIFTENKMNTKSLTKKTKEFFQRKLKRRDKVYFNKIRAKDINGQIQQLTGIQIEVR